MQNKPSNVTLRLCQSKLNHRVTNNCIVVKQKYFKVTTSQSNWFTYTVNLR